jgi:hypothetical protein
VRGQETPIGDYPRIDNPFVHTEFGDRRYEISDGEYGLVLDFALDLRRAQAPRPPHGPGGRPEPPGHGGACPPPDHAGSARGAHGFFGRPDCPDPWDAGGRVHSRHPRWPTPSLPSR